MWNGRTQSALAMAIAWACLVVGAPKAPAQAEKPDTIFSKSDKLTGDDEKDTSAQTRSSHRKLYKIKLSEGQVVRIDLNSQDFDTFLRLENAAGKELASNDDVAPGNLNSRINFVAPKTGEYRVVATTFEPGKTGAFELTVKALAGAEAADARLQARVDAFESSSPAEQKKILAEFTKALQVKGNDKLTIPDAQRALNLAMHIDESDVDLTRKVCRDFAKIFDAAGNKQLAVVSKLLDQQVLKHLDKIGKEMDISGKTVEGKEFNLKDLKGKVVLVDFWATWCGPCVAELPNVMDCYKKYHPRGFEVIGVSLDRNDDAIVKFAKAKQMPWACINVEDSKKLAEKYDVNAIPHPVLVGRDGRVVSLRARGPQLQRLLEKLIDTKK